VWSASEPIARRWIVPMCVWKLSDCKNGSDCHKRPCWKNSIGVSVLRPCGSDVCSKSCRLFKCSVLTVWSAIKFHCEIQPTNTLQYKVPHSLNN
jgi:hypothetical protein